MNFNRPGTIEPQKIDPGETGREVEAPPVHRKRSRHKGVLSAVALLLLVGGVLANGARNHYAQSREVDAIAEASRDVVPQVHIETLQPADKIDVVSLPATTSAFSAANIF